MASDPGRPALRERSDPTFSRFRIPPGPPARPSHWRSCRRAHCDCYLPGFGGRGPSLSGANGPFELEQTGRNSSGLDRSRGCSGPRAHSWHAPRFDQDHPTLAVGNFAALRAASGPTFGSSSDSRRSMEPRFGCQRHAGLRNASAVMSTNRSQATASPSVASPMRADSGTMLSASDYSKRRTGGCCRTLRASRSTSRMRTSAVPWSSWRSTAAPSGHNASARLLAFGPRSIGTRDGRRRPKGCIPNEHVVLGIDGLRARVGQPSAVSFPARQHNLGQK